jgi:hypothetical protein
MTRKWLTSWVAVLIVTGPSALAQSVNIAAIRSAAETASEDLKNCAVDELRSQLFRGQGGGGQSKSGRHQECYVSAIQKPKLLIQAWASQPETSQDDQCIQRLTKTISSIEVELLSALSAEGHSVRAVALKNLRDQVRGELFEVLDYCEHKE